MEKPLVSICCITYNHEPYIRDCLEGFMMQQTNFPFEVLIHDDASTDHTADIIREYEAKYPDIIKPIYEAENQYSKGVSAIVLFGFERAQGKYIALCEGDDFWCDPHKLQIQFDFMESHPDFSICFHNVDIVDEHGVIVHNDTISQNASAWGNVASRDIFTIMDLLKYGNLMNTPSVFYRKPAHIYPSKGFTADYFMHLQMAINGKIKRIDGIMACYRVHPGGIFASLARQSMDKRISVCEQQIGGWEQFINHTPLSPQQRYHARKKMLAEYDRLRSFWAKSGNVNKAKSIAYSEVSGFFSLLMMDPRKIASIVKTVFR